MTIFQTGSLSFSLYQGNYITKHRLTQEISVFLLFFNSVSASFQFSLLHYLTGTHQTIRIANK